MVITGVLAASQRAIPSGNRPSRAVLLFNAGEDFEWRYLALIDTLIGCAVGGGIPLA